MTGIRGIRQEVLCLLAGVVVAVLAIRGFLDTSLAYDNYRIALGVGNLRIHPGELIFYMWYTLYGLVAIIGLTIALVNVNIVDKLAQGVDRFLENPPVFVGTVMAVVFIMVLLFRLFVLLQAPVADDESTYVFIAKTLLHGRVTNPVPEDPAFFKNQFIIINEHGWFGKYPIGHPLLLAIGIATNTLLLVGPVLAAITVVLTFLVGNKLFGRNVAALGIVLLAVSPHFIATFATLLSQSSSTVWMLAGAYTLLLLKENRKWYWALLSSAAWGMGIVTRPLPGVFFLFAAILFYCIPSSGIPVQTYLKQHWKNAMVALVPIVVALVVMLMVNKAQTGGFLSNAYQANHGVSMGIGVGEEWQRSVSVGASLLRQSFWLLGAPFLCGVFMLFVKINRNVIIAFGLIAAEYAYRIFAPKTCVASTGPVYVTEIVPVILLLLASGAVQFHKKLIEFKDSPVLSRLTLSIFTATIIVSVICFLPIQIRELQMGAERWTSIERWLKQNSIHNTIVFTNYMVFPQEMETWAYFPPNNSPDLNDDVLWLKIPAEATKQKLIDFRKKKFIDKSAYLVLYEKGVRQMIRLE